jgi:hypothetical protein
MTIYVVQGSTGEYSDHREWLVRAYSDEEKAKAKVVRCTERANAAQAAGVCIYDSVESAPFRNEDPMLQLDYTGTNYSILKVEYEP